MSRTDLDLTELRREAVTRIAPGRKWRLPDLRELFAYRELLYLLTWRDVTVRYKQTALGASWAVLQPVLTTLIFSIFFGHLGKISSEGVPYPIFSLVAVVPWTLFANGLLLGSNSLVVNASMITKIYFPRLLMPVATLLAGLLDFVIGLVLVIAFMGWYGRVLGPAALWVVPLLMIEICASVGVTAWLSALNVRYRDVRYVVPFLVQIWLFATPIAYPLTLLPKQWRPLLGLNPMTGVVEGFRAVLLHTGSDVAPTIAVSAVTSVVFLLGGLLYFQRAERGFADVV